MRVSFEHHEVRKGLIFAKTYCRVTVSVQFSEEEKYVMRQQRLQERVVLERDPGADWATDTLNLRDDMVRDGIFHLHVKDLMKPNTYMCRTNAEAKMYEAQVIDALKNLKLFLGASGTKAESKTIEL